MARRTSKPVSLTELGATPIDIERLISAWNAECVERRALGRHGPLPEPAQAVNPD
jgi:hypothetical protein